jgi:exodeoxyribonuclease VII small subunit
MPKKDVVPVDSLTYEQAFTELEKVIADLEEGQATLDNSVELFQRGQALAKRCADLLENARLKVSLLEQSGQPAGEKEEYTHEL